MPPGKASLPTEPRVIAVIEGREENLVDGKSVVVSTMAGQSAMSELNDANTNFSETENFSSDSETSRPLKRTSSVGRRRVAKSPNLKIRCCFEAAEDKKTGTGGSGGHRS